MPRREPKAYLLDLILACDTIVEYSARASLEQYGNDRGLRSIVERQLFIVGEAVQQLKRLEPLEVHTLGPVGEMIRVRNVLAHVYFGVRNDLIWDIVRNHVPELRTRARTWLDRLERPTS